MIQPLSKFSSRPVLLKPLAAKYGRLNPLVDEIYGKGRDLMVMCVCDCGKRINVRIQLLRRGASKSCGCLAVDLLKQRSTKHGKHQTSVYWAWTSMMARCYNPRNCNFRNYGGRGIRVHEQWHTFDGFFKSMGEKPPHTSLERIDNNGDYGPSNCRWATRKEQARNKRTSRVLTFQGRAACVSDWAESTGLSVSNIHCRLKSGWSVDRTLSTPPRPYVRKQVDGGWGYE